MKQLISVLRPIARYKKYYRSWRIPYSLEDAQTLEEAELNPYDAWLQEWNQSSLPKQLRAFDPCLLPGHLKARKRPQPSYFEPRSKSESTLDYKRQLFGHYGTASGVDPGVLFLDSQMLEYERELERATERPVQQLLDEHRQRQIDEAKETDELMKKIKANLAKMPAMIEQYNKQRAKQDEQSKQTKERQQAIIEEARDRFGYYLSPRDPKFIKLREEMEEQNKVMRKEEKKAAKKR